MSLCVVILTFNEEQHIEAAVESAKKVAEEILVIDSGSSDKTVVLAEKHGARVLFRPWDDDFAAARNFADDKTEAQWLLHLDADERISDELADSIKKALLGSERKIYAFKRSNNAFGKEFKYGVFHPDRVRRLYPRGKAIWIGKVHESIQSDLPRVCLFGKLVHYTYSDWEQYFYKFNKYTSIWARQAYDAGKSTSMATAFAHAVFALIKTLLLHGGFLDGLIGIATCFMYFSYTLVKYLKLYQLQVGRERVSAD